jgi:hypothetical protein
MLLEEIISQNGKWNAQIFQREDGLLRVWLCFWDAPGPDDYPYKPQWSPIGRQPGSITDSLEIARGIARALILSRDQPETNVG